MILQVFFEESLWSFLSVQLDQSYRNMFRLFFTDELVLKRQGKNLPKEELSVAVSPSLYGLRLCLCPCPCVRLLWLNLYLNPNHSYLYLIVSLYYLQMSDRSVPGCTESDYLLTLSIMFVDESEARIRPITCCIYVGRLVGFYKILTQH